MRRHRFDPLSLVCGLLFATAGTIVLLGGSLTDEGAFLAPTGLIALGVAFLLEARHRDGGSTAGPSSGDGDDGGGDDGARSDETG